MDYQELIERLHIKAGHNQYKFSDALMIEAANAIESLLAENDRLKHNLTSTEQTMREYQELAAKRLEEIAKYRDAPVVVWRTRPYDYGIGHKGIYASTHFKEQSEAWKRNGWRVEELIVKPGEEK